MSIGHLASDAPSSTCLTAFFLLRFHFCWRFLYFSAFSFAFPFSVFVRILRTLVSFRYLGFFAPFVGAIGPGAMKSFRSFSCAADAASVAASSVPASCTVRQRAAIPASYSTPEVSSLSRSVSTEELSNRSFSDTVFSLYGNDFGVLPAVSPFVRGALLSLFLLVLARPVQRTESLSSSFFTRRCAWARSHILLTGGLLSPQRGVLSCRLSDSRCFGRSRKLLHPIRSGGLGLRFLLQVFLFVVLGFVSEALPPRGSSFVYDPLPAFPFLSQRALLLVLSRLLAFLAVSHRFSSHVCVQLLS